MDHARLTPTNGPQLVRWHLPGPVADALRQRAVREDRVPEREAIRILAAALRDSGDLAGWPPADAVAAAG
jgi:plasmid stability protein